MPLLVSVKEATKITGLSRATLYRMFASGKIVARKHGRRTLIVVKELEDYVQSLPPAYAQ